MDDHQLLTAYARHADQGAFAQLVHRHVDLVYAAALRQTRGDRHLAEDVTQATFLILAQKAGRLPSGVVLAGWLHATARYAAANAMKSAARRARREQRKFQMDANPAQIARPTADPDPDTPWDDVAPHLDAALASLAVRDRDAVLLRYVQDKTHTDVGHALGISEEAARKRITRALDRLRTILHRRGVAVPATALGASLSTNAATAAPPAVVATVLSSSACATAPPAATAALAKSTLSTISWIKAKLVAACLATAAVLATGGVITVHTLAADARRPATPAVPAPATTVLAMAPALPPPPTPPASSPYPAQGTLRTRDDAPVADAEVYIILPEDPALNAAWRDYQSRLSAGQKVDPPPRKRQASLQVYAKWPDDVQTTDAAGQFTVPAAADPTPWILLARHDAGFVRLTRDQYAAAAGQVTLQPWARVDGTLRAGTQPQLNQKVVLFGNPNLEGWDADRTYFSRETRTDPEGHFAFDRVIPGEAWLAWDTTTPTFRRNQYMLIEPAPGQSLTQDVGGKGRPVVGRAATVSGDPSHQPIDWTTTKTRHAEALYHNVRGVELGKAMPLPPGFERMTRLEQMKYEREWYKTPQGRERNRLRWAQQVPLKPDGSFRIDDVAPGTYELALRILQTDNGYGEDLVQCRQQFTVPPFPPGVDRSDEPLDLGTVKVDLKPRALPGTPAPDFETTALDGRTIRLSDFRGKYVLLKWWWNWSNLDTEVPALKKASEMLKHRPDWTILTVAFDNERETARKRVTDRAIPGLHCQTPDYKTGFPAAYLGSPSTLILIGPDGKVLARNLHPESADTEVAKILLEHAR